MNVMSITNEEENRDKKKKNSAGEFYCLLFWVKIQVPDLVAAVINF